MYPPPQQRTHWSPHAWVECPEKHVKKVENPSSRHSAHLRATSSRSPVMISHSIWWDIYLTRYRPFTNIPMPHSTVATMKALLLWRPNPRPVGTSGHRPTMYTTRIGLCFYVFISSSGSIQFTQQGSDAPYMIVIVGNGYYGLNYA